EAFCAGSGVLLVRRGSRFEVRGTRCQVTGPRTRYLAPRTFLLLRVQLHNQLLINRQIDVLALGQSDDPAGEIVRLSIDPVDAVLTGGKVPGRGENRELLGTLADRDLIADLALEARDVDLAAVHLHVAVANKLAGLAARNREAEAVGDVVETGLELLQQQFAGDAGLVRGLLIVGAELRLEGEVHALGLLLLTQLQTIADELLDLLRLAVLAGGEVALFDGALVGKALRALEEQLLTVAAAEAADGSGITCHFLSIS